MRQNTDDYPIIYLFYVFLMFGALGLATVIAAFLLMK